jgi:hypothetical protein
MSFILDSLKQLEREKKTPHAPDLSLLHGPDKPSSRLRWLGLAVVGILIANVVGWFWYVNADRSPHAPAAKTEQPSPLRRQSDQTIAATKPDASRTPGTTRSLQAETRIRPRKPRTPASANPSQPAETVPVASVPPTAAAVNGTTDTGRKSPEAPKPMVSDEPRDPPAEATTAPPPLSDEIAQTLEEPPQAPADALPPITTPPADKSLTAWKALSPEVREQLKALKINVHSYDPDPAGRIVFVNMRSYREGERIGRQGPLLHAITPEGIVVDLDDARVMLPVTP